MNRLKSVWKNHKMKILTCGYFLLLVIGVGFSMTGGKTEVFSLEKKTILVDAGHGGIDPGKVVTEGAEEKEINLKIASYLAEYLEQGGAAVYMTRTDDETMAEGKRADLRERRSLAQGEEVDLFVSIHQNFYPSEEVRGAQVFYPKNSDESKALADSIQGRIKELADGENNRVIKENDSYYMLKGAKKPSVIVECGFLSNPEENRLLNSEDYQKKIAWAIFIGISDYFGKEV